MLGALFSNTHSYQSQVIALYLSFGPVAAILLLMVAAFVYNWHRNHHHHHPH